ncbi:RES domain protein [compost metagenome]
MVKSILGSQLHDALSAVFQCKNHPVLILNKIIYRVQPTYGQDGNEIVEGFRFSAPETKLGRYNDPTLRLMVCYFSERRTGALAEVFGRREVEGSVGVRKVLIDRDDFESRSVACVKTKRPLRLFDLSKALIHLNLNQSMVSSTDYELTQQLVVYFAENSNLGIDGIVYRSTHAPDELCYAVWVRNGEDSPLTTDSIQCLKDIECDEVPSTWDVGESIGMEEILTEVLGFSIPNKMA